MNWLKRCQNLFRKKRNEQKAITEDLYIERALTTLRDKQQAVNIQFYRYQTPFVSTVLYISPAHDFLLLDEINHAEGNLHALNAEPFVVKAQCGEDLVIFEGQVSRLQALRGMRCYRIAYPKNVAHSKRRGCPRFALQEKKADLFVKHFPHIKAYIKDISMVGVSICLPKHLRNVLNAFAEVNECRIVLQHAPTYSFSATLKNYRNDFDNQQLILGCEFTNLDNTRLKLLAQLITQAKTP